MLVTALNQHDRLRQRGQGRQARAQEAHYAAGGGLELKLVTAEEFDRVVRPEKMVSP